MLHANVHTLPHPARWDDVRYLLAVVRGGSFSAAAGLLGVEQSTVSRRIAALEAALGGALFDRAASGLRPTALALGLFPAAERMEAELGALLDQSAALRERVEGRVRLAVPSSFAVQVVVPLLLPALRARHPALYLDLLVGERAADLVQREAEVALRFFRPQGGDLLARRLATLPTAVLAHRDYVGTRAARAAGTADAARPARVDALDWIVLDLGSEAGASAETAYLAAHPGVVPAVRTNSHLAQVEAVRAGLGVALLARVIRQLDPALVELDLPPGPDVELWLVAPRSLAEVPKVRAVWDFLVQHLEDLAALGPVPAETSADGKRDR